MPFETRRPGAAADAIAPDGSEVRILAGLSRGGLAVFSAPPGAVARAVAHRTVEELWYVIAGRGQMWRKLGPEEKIVELDPGVSLAIPTGASFQFRCDGAEVLIILGATMPPWPGPSEAYSVEGIWPSTM